MKQKLLLASLLFYSVIFGQTFTINGQFNQFFTYYIVSFDTETGETDVQLFNYDLACPDCPKTGKYYDPPVSLGVTFSATMKSPFLGKTSRETVAYIYTKEPFDIKAPVNIDNRQFTTETLEIYDIYGNEVPIKIGVDDNKTLSEDDIMDMLYSVLAEPKLPDGEYTLKFIVEAGYYDHDSDTWTSKFPVDCPNCSEEIIITTPQRIDLADGQPGGPWDQLIENEINQANPYFYWSSDVLSDVIMEQCDECGFYIRVAEFRCDEHSSIDDAIDDFTILPISDAEDWFYIGNPPDQKYQYPTIDAVDLEPGGIYVYQVQKRISTTTGVEEINSPIYAFRYADEYNQKMEDLKGLLTETTYDLLFQPCGDLTGYTVTGEFNLDNVDFSEGEWQKITELVEKINQGDLSIGSWEVR